MLFGGLGVVAVGALVDIASKMGRFEGSIVQILKNQGARLDDHEVRLRTHEGDPRLDDHERRLNFLETDKTVGDHENRIRHLEAKR